MLHINPPTTQHCKTGHYKWHSPFKMQCRGVLLVQGNRPFCIFPPSLKGSSEPLPEATVLKGGFSPLSGVQRKGCPPVPSPATGTHTSNMAGYSLLSL